MAMEIGEFTIKKMRESMVKEDLDVNMKCGCIIQGKWGSLLALRTNLAQTTCFDMVYVTFASQPLYVVKWNDLSEKKQQELLAKKEGGKIGT